MRERYIIGLESGGIATTVGVLFYALGLVITIGLIGGLSIVLLAQVIKTRGFYEFALQVGIRHIIQDQ